MSKEEIKREFELRAAVIENSNMVDDLAKILIKDKKEREIHVASWRWNEVINELQPIVIYNPNWSKNFSTTIESYFYMEIFGRKYKVFALLDRGEY